MPNDATPVRRIEYTDEVKRALKNLSKKYRHIHSDVQPFLDRLHAGEMLGDRVVGTVGYTVFKTRIPNRDIGRGKQGGYRLIYCLLSPTFVVLVSIYSKTEQSDISTEEIRRIIQRFEKQ